MTLKLRTKQGKTTYKLAMGSFNTPHREAAGDTQAERAISIAREDFIQKFSVVMTKRYDSLVDESKFCALVRNIFNFLNLKILREFFQLTPTKNCIGLFTYEQLPLRMTTRKVDRSGVSSGSGLQASSSTEVSFEVA